MHRYAPNQPKDHLWLTDHTLPPQTPTVEPSSHCADHCRTNNIHPSHALSPLTPTKTAGRRKEVGITTLPQWYPTSSSLDLGRRAPQAFKSIQLFKILLTGSNLWKEPPKETAVDKSLICISSLLYPCAHYTIKGNQEREPTLPTPAQSWQQSANPETVITMQESRRHTIYV